MYKPPHNFCLSCFSMLLLVLLFPSEKVSGQCGGFLQGDTLIVDCGDTASLYAFSVSLGSQLSENFNDEAVDSGFTTNSDPTFSNPCKPSLDSSTYAWFDHNSSPLRYIRTVEITPDSTTEICFDLRMAEQGNPYPCEGPDLPDEGVSFDYSTDGGSTWKPIQYFDPDTACCGCGGGCGGYPPSPFVEWDNYCMSVPDSLSGIPTQFRWFQLSGSGQYYDHWGLDNISINNGNSDSSLVYDWGNGITSREDSNFVPNDSSDLTVEIIDTLEQDTCQASSYVAYRPIDVRITPPNPSTCGEDSIQLLAEPYYSGERPFYLHMSDGVINDSSGWDQAKIVVHLKGDTSIHKDHGWGNPYSLHTIDTLTGPCYDSLKLEYIAGPNDDDYSYWLLDSQGDTLYYEGNPQSSKTFYADEVNCTPSENFTYHWTPNTALSSSSDKIIKSGTDTPITYTLTVQDSTHAFCQDSDTVKVETEPPSVSIGPDTSLCMDDSLTLGIPSPHGYASVVWDDMVSSDSIVVDSSYGPSPQQHWVTVTDSSGCSVSDSILVEFSICSGLKEENGSLSVKILPNPASEQVTVKIQDDRLSKDLQIQLFDPSGRKVFDKELQRGDRKAMLDVSPLASGAYYLTLTHGARAYQEMLIVK